MSPYERDQEKTRKAFKTAVSAAAAVLIVMGGVISLDTVPEGHVGLKRTLITGTYADSLATQGLNFLPFDIVRDLNIQQQPYKILDSKPKDKDGVLLEDLDVTISIGLNPSVAHDPELQKSLVQFIRDTGDVQGATVGTKLFERVSRSSVSDATFKFTTEEMLGNKQSFESELSKTIQANLDSQFPNLFKVASSEAMGIKANAAVEANMATVAAAKTAANAARSRSEAEDVRVSSQIKILKKNEELLREEAKQITTMASALGMTPREYMTIRFQEDLAKAALEASGKGTLQSMMVGSVAGPSR